jgi:hypothetical protein
LTQKACKELKFQRRIHRTTLPETPSLGSEGDGDKLVPKTPSPPESTQPAAVAQNDKIFSSPLPDLSMDEYTRDSESGNSENSLFVDKRTGNCSSPFNRDIQSAPRVNYIAR